MGVLFQKVLPAKHNTGQVIIKSYNTCTKKQKKTLAVIKEQELV